MDLLQFIKFSNFLIQGFFCKLIFRYLIDLFLVIVISNSYHIYCMQIFIIIYRICQYI